MVVKRSTSSAPLGEGERIRSSADVGCETEIYGADGAGAQPLLFNREVVGVDWE